ncbi:hypothetical protein MMC30_005914 [Trapelia coarctata]|nr:hypothetical protein [Trapelia coarctata]
MSLFFAGLLFLLLSCQLTSVIGALNEPKCHLDNHNRYILHNPPQLGQWSATEQGKHPLPDDCARAIAIIPSGAFTVDPRHGDHDSKLDLQFPPGSRTRKFFMPAAFRAGTCLVTVDASAAGKEGSSSRKPPASIKPASHMYSAVWPNVKVQARKIVAKCLGGSREQTNAGTVATESWLGDFYFPYYITVCPTLHGLAGDGGKANLMRNIGVGHNRMIQYNVYEAGDSASGQGAMQGEGHRMLRGTLMTH